MGDTETVTLGKTEEARTGTADPCPVRATVAAIDSVLQEINEVMEDEEKSDALKGGLVAQYKREGQRLWVRLGKAADKLAKA